MASMVDPPPDGKRCGDPYSGIGCPDPECTHGYGVDSACHLIEARADLRAWLLIHLSGRHVKLYGGSEGLLHHESVDEIIDGLLRDAD